MTYAAAPNTAHVTGWDRSAVFLLGSAGCALSYDALQQMAVAIHVRGFLTYLFPLVIDGFIAYGVRALLVLRSAPLRARLYVWSLFGTATAASVWANALHAVRLNEEITSTSGLRLGNAVVAILSTLAPLALAGAVHLYILMARGTAGHRDRRDAGQPGRARTAVSVTRTDRAGQETARVTTGLPAAAMTEVAGETKAPRGQQDPDSRTGAGGTMPHDGTDAEIHHGTGATRAAELHGQPDTLLADGGLPTAVEAVTSRPDRQTKDGRRPDPDTKELLRIARTAVAAEDKLTRRVVAQAIRGDGIPLSNDRLTDLMAKLRTQSGHRS